MNPSGQPQQPDLSMITNEHIEGLKEQRDEVSTKLALVQEMKILGIDEERNDAFLGRATMTLQKLRGLGVGEDMAVSFASVEAALVEASQSNTSTDGIFAAIEPSAVKLVTYLLKPAFKSPDNARIVFARTKVLMGADSSKFFVDALLEAVHEREFNVEKNGQNEVVYADASGVVSLSNKDFQE